MSYRPGKLRRVLDPIVGAGNYAFAVFSTDLGGLYEDTIQEISIYRGKSGRGGGSFPAVMELQLKGRYAAAASGKNVRLFLRASAADALAAHCSTTRAAIESRYTGRLGATSVTDDGKTFTTTYAASSWIAQMNYSPKHYTPLAGQDLGTVIKGISHAVEPLRGITMETLGTFDTIATDQPPTLFRDGVGKYAEDLGILLQETRDGKTRVFGHSYRKALTDSRLTTDLPVMRAHAISPAEWKQPNERPGIIVKFIVTNADGNLSERTAQISNPTGELRETQDIDWSFMKVAATENQGYREAYGRVFEASTRQFRIESVKVDLLHLLSSTNQYHRRLAGQMLALEHGDPLFFSGDWPTELRGAHFAEGIKETVTANSWDMELDLVPYAQAIGYTPTPTVPARAWDSATYAWDTETRKWDES